MKLARKKTSKIK